jgi:hypothetical protein
VETQEISLDCARKLIEGAVEYAARAELSAHPDYRDLQRIFADVDASRCPREFAYGHDGKPFFTQGPHDSPEFCRHVMEKLAGHYGPDGFNFMVTELSAIPVGEDDGRRR